MIALGFVAAAAIATLARWQVTARLGRASGTMLVNLVGAFLLGALAGTDETGATIMGLAALGSLTTFSTLALVIVELAESRPSTAVVYGFVTFTMGVAAAWFGLQLS